MSVLCGRSGYLIRIPSFHLGHAGLNTQVCIWSGIYPSIVDTQSDTVRKLSILKEDLNLSFFSVWFFSFKSQLAKLFVFRWIVSLKSVKYLQHVIIGTKAISCCSRHIKYNIETSTKCQVINKLRRKKTERLWRIWEWGGGKLYS